MPHFITDTCIGCTACASMCPTDAISGVRKELHIIEPELCIDCGVCGNVCPVQCILDAVGNVIPKVKLKDRVKARVDSDLCTGCDFCVDICPYDAITMEDDPKGEFTPVAVVSDEKCVGCRLCEEACIKNAIVVDGLFDRYNTVVKQYGDLHARPAAPYPVGGPKK